MTQDSSTSPAGKLIVQVRTAEGSIPVPNAKITVLSYNENESTVIASGNTDESGSTRRIEIVTPNRELSESPGNPPGYTKLIILAEKDGFLSDEFIGASVFPGVTTVQGVNLIPLPEFSVQGENTQIFESEAADL